MKVKDADGPLRVKQDIVDLGGNFASECVLDMRVYFTIRWIQHDVYDEIDVTWSNE